MCQGKQDTLAFTSNSEPNRCCNLIPNFLWLTDKAAGARGAEMRGHLLQREHLKTKKHPSRASSRHATIPWLQTPHHAREPPPTQPNPALHLRKQVILTSTCEGAQRDAKGCQEGETGTEVSEASRWDPSSQQTEVGQAPGGTH